MCKTNLRIAANLRPFMDQLELELTLACHIANAWQAVKKIIGKFLAFIRLLMKAESIY